MSSLPVLGALCGVPHLCCPSLVKPHLMPTCLLFWLQLQDHSGGWPAVRVTGIPLPQQQWPKGVWWGQWIFPADMGQEKWSGEGVRPPVPAVLGFGLFSHLSCFSFTRSICPSIIPVSSEPSHWNSLHPSALWAKQWLRCLLVESMPDPPCAAFWVLSTS